MLAESARRGGYRPFVFDLFGDTDTRALAETSVVANADGGLDEDLCLNTVRAHAATQPHSALVYGSALENHPELLAALSRVVPLLGNPPEVVRACRTPEYFFAALRRLGIPHPATRFTPPDTTDDWLVKPRRATGGCGIRPLTPDAPPTTDDYLQRFMPGHALSALFLADGHRAVPIGYNTQWSAPPYRFAGALNRAPLTETQHRCLDVWLTAITRHFRLRGLNSLDFLGRGDALWVLEINPRPGATLALYDADWPLGLLHAHLDAVAGHLPATLPTSPARALRVVFADRAGRVPAGVGWPAGCRDIPAPGTEFRAADPLCTILAQGATAAEAATVSQARAQAVRAACQAG